MFEKLQFWKKSSSIDSSSNSDFPMPDFSDTSSYSQDQSMNSASNPSSTGINQSSSHTGVGVDATYPTGLDSPSLSSHSQAPIQDPFADSMNKASQSGEGLPSSFDTPSVNPPAQSTPSGSEQQSTDMSKRDVDLILSRLDLIKSEIENMQHRMVQLEQEVKNHQKNNVW